LQRVGEVIAMRLRGFAAGSAQATI